jgi:type II secretory pathway pseudopilin PulG
MKQLQKGFISIETIIVLVVVLSLLALGASRMDMLSTLGDTTEETSNILALYTNTKGLRSSQGYGTSGTDLTSQLIAIKGIPKNMSIIEGKLYNIFNGVVEIKSTGLGFSISTAKLSVDVCNRLATKISRSGSFANTVINSGSPIVGEITPAVSTTQCNSDSNIILWNSVS